MLQFAGVALGTQPGELSLEVTYTSAKVSDLVDKTTIGERTYITEKGLSHLEGLHARRIGGSGEARARRKGRGARAYKNRVARLARSVNVCQCSACSPGVIARQTQ
jgi:hypothetical protein